MYVYVKGMGMLVCAQVARYQRLLKMARQTLEEQQKASQAKVVYVEARTYTHACVHHYACGLYMCRGVSTCMLYACASNIELFVCHHAQCVGFANRAAA
jgi:hypothetical protein